MRIRVETPLARWYKIQDWQVSKWKLTKMFCLWLSKMTLKCYKSFIKMTHYLWTLALGSYRHRSMLVLHYKSPYVCLITSYTLSSIQYICVLSRFIFLMTLCSIATGGKHITITQYHKYGMYEQWMLYNDKRIWVVLLSKSDCGSFRYNIFNIQWRVTEFP